MLMAENDNDTPMDKVDALAAMAEGKDISKQGFNAPEHIPDGDADSENAAAAVLAAAQAASDGAPAPEVTAGGGAASARKSRAVALKRQRQRVHAEQFKRMMVPILLVTGVLLIVLGGIVAFMMTGQEEGMYTGSDMFHDPGLKRIMVITAFPLGAILFIGAWLFRADLKRADKMAQREQAAKKKE